MSWIMDYRDRPLVDLAPTPKNDPKLLAPVNVRVRRPFYVGGQEARIGDEIKLPRHDAVSLQAIGKVEILEA